MKNYKTKHRKTKRRNRSGALIRSVRVSESYLPHLNNIIKGQTKRDDMFIKYDNIDDNHNDYLSSQINNFNSILNSLKNERY